MRYTVRDETKQRRKGFCKMDKMQFREFCQKEFYARGFKKHKNMYYLAGHDLLCGMDLQKSRFGEVYYINFCYFIGNFENTKVYPTFYECDIHGRITVMSKSQTFEGKQFMTPMFEYGDYTEEELRPYFEKGFEEKIFPPLRQGKKFFLENPDLLGKIYGLSVLNPKPEEVMEKLKA